MVSCFKIKIKKKRRKKRKRKRKRKENGTSIKIAKRIKTKIFFSPCSCLIWLTSNTTLDLRMGAKKKRKPVYIYNNMDINKDLYFLTRPCKLYARGTLPNGLNSILCLYIYFIFFLLFFYFFLASKERGSNFGLRQSGK
jgi:hypothetical protein